MAILRPRLAILDETDSGLDIDALKIVADGVNALRGPDFSALVITHYQRLLDHIVPDRVHVLAGGRIVRSGGPELARELEAQRLRRAGRGGRGMTALAKTLPARTERCRGRSSRATRGCAAGCPATLRCARRRRHRSAPAACRALRDEAWKYTDLRPLAEAAFHEPLTPDRLRRRCSRGCRDRRAASGVRRWPLPRRSVRSAAGRAFAPFARRSELRPARPARARAAGRAEHHAGRGRRHI